MSQDPFIEAVELSSVGPVRYLDARNQAAFDAGHAPNAVRVPVDVWDKAAKADASVFENTAWWSNALRDLGVGETALPVVYEGGTMTDAARVWWVLQYFGLPCRIVNGGWAALSAAASAPAGAPASITPPHLHPAAKGSVGTVERSELKQQLDGGVRVFDSRTRAEYTGEDLRKNPRGGHLPGARHLSHVDLLENGFVRPAATLHQMMAQAGFGPGDHIVTHCQGGGRAALAAAAAVRAGFGDVRVYYRSFADWAADESCPIVKD